MKKIEILFKKLYEDAQLPTQAHFGDAGLDLYFHNTDCNHPWLEPGDCVLLKCGFAMDIPLGWEAQIRPRSGLALKKGLTVLNSPGTIDSSYRGEIGVLLFATKQVDFPQKGDRIAQMVISEVPQVIIKEVKELSTTQRNFDGFGSSGT